MDVVLKQAPDGVAVTVGETVLHTVETAAEAQQLALWVRYQLGEGRSVDDIGRLLRGEPAGDEPVDLSVLEGSVPALRQSLASGAFDTVLEALLAAEVEGKNRRGAVSALRKRHEEVG